MSPKLKYRVIASCFWSDPEVIEQFTPDEKLFYLYIITNEHTEICGIYRLLKKHIMIETGFTREVIENLLDRFQNNYGKIFYDHETQEIVVRNWLKYQNINSPKIQTGIQRGLENVRNKELIRYLRVPDTVSIPPIYDMDTVRRTDTDTDTETDTKTETETEEKREYASSVSMTEEQYDKLNEKLGKELTTEYIQRLSDYKIGYGKQKKYKSDYHVILTWHRKAEKQEGKRNGQEDTFAKRRQRQRR